MNPSTPDSAEAVNVRIAELCGWKCINATGRHAVGMCPPFNRPAMACIERVPNYSGSLDAMHEAEKTLTKDERHQYYLEACRIINEANRDTPHWAGASPFHYMTMTAAQRAAAFLTTKTRTNL